MAFALVRKWPKRGLCVTEKVTGAGEELIHWAGCAPTVAGRPAPLQILDHARPTAHSIEEAFVRTDASRR